MSRPSVAIVGGGILGMTAAYRLAQSGVQRLALRARARPRRARRLVRLRRDAGRSLLPRRAPVGRPRARPRRGARASRPFRFRPTKVGFYDDGRLFSMTTPKEALTFPLLTPLERLRLGAFVARCQLTKNFDALDDEPLLDWLTPHVRPRRRREALEAAPRLEVRRGVRRPPATYIWARTRRMGSTRDRSGREVMGWPYGGYQGIIDALGAEDPLAGRRGARSDGGVADHRRCERCDRSRRRRAVPRVRLRALHARATAGAAPARARARRGCAGRPLPLSRSCLPAAPRLDESVSPYYHLNITDRRVKLTTVVETTHVVDPEAVGGHLVYVSRYVDPAHPDRSARLTRSRRIISATRRRSSPTCGTTRSSRASSSVPA